MAQGFYGGYMGNAGALDDLVYRGQPSQMMPLPYYGGGFNVQQLANFSGPAQLSTDVISANIPGSNVTGMRSGFSGPAQLSTDVIKANIPGANLAGTPSFDINRGKGALGGRSGEQLKRIYEGGTKDNEQLNQELMRRGIMPGGPKLPMAMMNQMGGQGVPGGFQNKMVY